MIEYNKDNNRLVAGIGRIYNTFKTFLATPPPIYIGLYTDSYDVDTIELIIGMYVEEGTRLTVLEEYILEFGYTDDERTEMLFNGANIKELLGGILLDYVAQYKSGVYKTLKGFLESTDSVITCDSTIAKLDIFSEVLSPSVMSCVIDIYENVDNLDDVLVLWYLTVVYTEPDSLITLDSYLVKHMESTGVMTTTEELGAICKIITINPNTESTELIELASKYGLLEVSKDLPVDLKDQHLEYIVNNSETYDDLKLAIQIVASWDILVSLGWNTPNCNTNIDAINILNN